MLAQRFNDNVGWHEIARDFITATGDVRENGATALVMAQEGKAEETTAEVSRIFLGIQIQCAQCHDHPTDRWKRKQFHELAAFFPRMAVRPVRDGDKRSFEVVSVDRRFRFGQRGRGSLEHHMPDLKNPTARGDLMTPTFFVSQEKVRLGASDQERRATLSDWITSKSDPWFARAFVNRIWAEMLGEGFYEPVDDLGPDRQCSAPATLDLLADQFALHDYEPKWLFATIASTEAYQRQSRPRRLPGETPFAASCPQPLRGDQLYDCLNQALGISSSFTRRGPRGGGPYGQFGPRASFNQTFGFDPSNPREEVTGSIPQALLMMNSPLINNAINARAPYSTLARLLSQVKDDKAVVSELYLRSLAREPRESEVETCLEHVKEVGGRAEAFEDILWALVNSTEFLYRK